MLPNNEIGTHRFPEENGRNSGNGNSNQNRKQFQQSRSQTKSSSDVKSFNRNGDNDSPFDKRLSSNAGMYVLKYGSQEKVPFWCRCSIFLSLTFVEI